MQENHYDPWGVNLVGIESEGNPTHRFQFNGKQKVDALGLHVNDHGARWYSLYEAPVWYQMDPLAEKYPEVSPYAFCLNNPINYFDPDGREAVGGPPPGDEAGQAAVQELHRGMDNAREAIRNLLSTVVGLFGIHLNLPRVGGGGDSYTSHDRNNNADGNHARKGDGSQREVDITHLGRAVSAAGAAAGQGAVTNPGEFVKTATTAYGTGADLGKSLGAQKVEDTVEVYGSTRKVYDPRTGDSVVTHLSYNKKEQYIRTTTTRIRR